MPANRRTSMGSGATSSDAWIPRTMLIGLRRPWTASSPHFRAWKDYQDGCSPTKMNLAGLAQMILLLMVKCLGKAMQSPVRAVHAAGLSALSQYHVLMSRALYVVLMSDMVVSMPEVLLSSAPYRTGFKWPPTSASAPVLFSWLEPIAAPFIRLFPID